MSRNTSHSTNLSRRALLGASGLCALGVVSNARATTVFGGIVLTEWQPGAGLRWVFANETQLNAIVTNAYGIVFQRLYNYLTNQYPDFSWHSVLRDTVSRGIASGYIATYIAEYARRTRGTTTTIGGFAIAIATQLGNAVFVSILQECFQLWLRFEKNVSEQKAKWIAFGLAWTEIGVVSGMLAAVILRQLSGEAKGVGQPYSPDSPPPGHASDSHYRRLLAKADVEGFGQGVFQFAGPTIVQSKRIGTLNRYLKVSGASMGYGESYPYEIHFYEVWAPFVGWISEKKYFVRWEKNANGAWVNSKVVHIPAVYFD
jgi:hypothetical protein